MKMMDRTGLDARCHQSHSITPLLSCAEEENDDKRLVGQKKGREESLKNYCHRQERLNLRKLLLFIANQIRGG